MDQQNSVDQESAIGNAPAPSGLASAEIGSSSSDGGVTDVGSSEIGAQVAGMKKAGGVDDSLLGDGDYSIHLEFFSGPMDLLLHLVQQREVSIEKVNLAAVCDQYLKIVSEQALVDLERAGEYLVIAATLIAIKSQALLPGEHALSGDEFPEGGDPAFYEALRERLKAYELTKRRAVTLLAQPQMGRTTFGRPRRAIAMDSVLEEDKEGEEAIEVGDIAGLGAYFVALMKRIGGGLKSYRVLTEPVSVVSYMMKLLDRLRLSPSADAIDEEPTNGTFITLLSKLWRVERPKEKKKNLPAARGAVIGSFLALLELMKRGLVKAQQGSDAEPISLDLNFTAPVADSTELESEFDEKFSNEEQPAENIIELAGARERDVSEDFEVEKRVAGGIGRG